VKITISKENYLKTIAEAESEGEPVIAATLARWLNVSAPAVTMAIKRLKRDSLIRVGRDGQLSLTPGGRDIANRLLNRHHLIERMLTEIFGMEWYKVHDEAEQLEHAVSADFERRLLERLGTGEACPHGNRVERDTPQDRRNRGWRPLDEVPSASGAVVVSVFERDRRLLEYLNGIGIRPGATVKMLATNYDDTLTLGIEGKPVQLGRAAAAKVWVGPLIGIQWGGPPWSAADAHVGLLVVWRLQRAGPGGPARTRGSAPLLAASSHWSIQLLEIRDGRPQAGFQVHFRLPTQNALSLVDLRLALLGIVFRKWLELDGRIDSRDPANPLGEFENGHLLRIAQINGIPFVRKCQPVKAVHQIVHVTETASL
jgi:DtxR family transcriptional regulator, Mn-dependent transcriptional regulator